MPTNNLSPKSKNKLGIASSIPPNMAERFGAAVSPYLQGAQALFPPANPYGQVVSNFLLGQAPQAAQQMAAGYPNVLFNTSNPLGGNRIVNPVALDMALALPVATAVKGAGMAGGGVAATFAGARARTADHAALALAERMKAAGVDDREIHKATRWFFGSADGRPRFEIPDDASFVDIGRYVESTNPWDPYAVANMGDGFKHQRLYGAYPDLKNASFFMRSQRGNNYSGDYKAATNDASEQIGVYPKFQEDVLQPDTAANKSTTLHELQHAIQQREGFARGGSPEGLPEALQNDAKSLREQARQLLDQGNRPEALALEKQARQLDSQIVWGAHAPHELYRRLAGEAEARLTQARMAMTGPERAASYPPDMYDVPVGDQIVRYGEGPALATAWHGSPHLFPPTPTNNLGEFNAAKIGTGEGSQSFSYGHYTGEARATGEEYRDGLAKNFPEATDAHISEDVRHFPGEDIGEHAASRAEKIFHQNGNIIYKFNDSSVGKMDSYGNYEAFGVPESYLYKVDIPDEHINRMLDWDKTWDQQPKNVQDSINTKALEKFYKTKEIPTSQILYHINQGKSPAESAEHFRSLGIPGVRYLDAGSRGAGEGTSNFVVFPGNENMMTILERNGQAMSPESQAIARYREIKGPKSVVRMEAALRTAGVPLPKNEPVAYIQRLVDQAHRRN